MPNVIEWIQLSPETKVLSFVRLTKHTGLGYYIGEGLSDARPLHPCSSDRPHLLSRHEALAFARLLPEVEALERAAEAYVDYYTMSCPGITSGDLENWEDEMRAKEKALRAALAPYQEASGG